MRTKESHHATGILQSRNLSMEVHVIDTFDLSRIEATLGGMLMAAPWLTAGLDGPTNRFGGPWHDVMTHHIALRLANGAFPTTRLVGPRRSLARHPFGSGLHGKCVPRYSEHQRRSGRVTQ